VLPARVFDCCLRLFNHSFSSGANLGSCDLLLSTLQIAPALLFFERSSSPAFLHFVDLSCFRRFGFPSRVFEPQQMRLKR
jgi:hypothetical protein